MASEDGMEELHLLHLAAINNVRELLVDRLEQGEDPNSIDNLGRTALHAAAYQGHDECLKILIEYGGNPNHVAEDGLTVLHRAALGGHLGCAQLLVSKGCCYPTVHGSAVESPIVCAEQEGHMDVANYLQEVVEQAHKAEVYDVVIDSCNGGNMQPVFDMVHRQPRILDAPFGCVCREDDESLLRWLCNACLSMSFEAVTPAAISTVLSLEALSGVPAASPFAPCQSPLHLACGSQTPHSLPLLRILLQHATTDLQSTGDSSTAALGGDQPDSFRDTSGKTPLHVALETQHVAAVLLMLASTGDAESVSAPTWRRLAHAWCHAPDDNGETAYHVAARMPDHRMLLSILDVSCSSVGCGVTGGLDTLCQRGVSPLAAAILDNLPENAALLLRHGASASRKCELAAPSFFPDAVQDVLAGCLGIPVCPWLLAQSLGFEELAQTLLTVDTAQLYFDEGSIVADPLSPILYSLLVRYPGAVHCIARVGGTAGEPRAWSVKISWKNLNLRLLCPEWLSTVVSEQAVSRHPDLLMLTHLDVSGNQLTELDAELLLHPNLTVLDFSDNRVAALPDLPSQRLPCSPLQQLLLADNRLVTLPASLFRLPSLSRLVLSNNHLESIPASVWTATKLTSLLVNFNHLSHFPDPPLLAIATSNPAARDPRSVVSLPAKLVANARDAAEGAESLSPRACDTELSRHGGHSANGRSFHSLSPDLVESDATRSGSRQHTQCVSWRSTCYQKRLSHPGYGIRSKQVLDDQLLDAQQVHADSVGGGAPSMFSLLTVLNLSNNRLESPPNGLSCIAPHLRRLNLSHNELSSLGCVGDYPSSLEELNLQASTAMDSHAGPQPEPVLHTQRRPCFCHRATSDRRRHRCRNSLHRQLPLLEILDLSANKLTSVELLDTKAADLGSRRNPGEYVSAMCTCLYPHLTNLDLRLNDLLAVPLGIGMARGLRSLKLDGNIRIQALPNELGALPPNKLCRLQCNGLELVDPPPTIIQGGVFAILAFLRGRLKRSVPYRHMKLMLVGLQDQGKTTLLRLLRREGHNIERALSTVGVDLGVWECRPTRRFLQLGQSFAPIHFNTWDFAGQREYYATHQCFLTTRSMFLAVWRIPTGVEGLSALDDWLRNIQARVPGATVVIVGTHLDEVAGGLRLCDELWLPILHKRYYIGSPTMEQEEHGYPHVVAVKFVSCAGSGTFIDELCTTIYETACAIPAVKQDNGNEKLVDQQVPAAYISLQEAVLALRLSLSDQVMPIISAAKFRQAFSNIIADAEELKVAVQFLHDNGVLLHYNDPKLKDLYFLDPQWLCNVLARIVTVREVMPFTKGGLLPVRSLGHVFNSERFPLHLASPCVQLLSKFEVAIQIDPETILIPSQLPMIAPPQAKLSHSSTWSATGGIRYQRLYLMVYVPNGFWPLLITRFLSSELKVDLCTYATNFVSLTSDTVHWRLWRHGIQLVLEDIPVLTIEEVTASDVLKRADTSQVAATLLDGTRWQPMALLDSARCLHVTVLDFKVNKPPANGPTAPPHTTEVVRSPSDVRADEELDGDLEPGPGAAESSSQTLPGTTEDDGLQARLLTECVTAVDSLLSDWYPGVGERHRHMSTGPAYVTRCLICPMCRAALGAPGILWECLPSAAATGAARPVSGQLDARCFPAPSNPPAPDVISVFLLDQLISLACHGLDAMQCHAHGPIPVMDIAPDVGFRDFRNDTLVDSENITRGDFVGSGAYGDVFHGTLRNVSGHKDIAIKVFQRSQQSFATDSVESSLAGEALAERILSLSSTSPVVDSFCALRQEAAVLQHLHHRNVMGLEGVMLNPVALLLEWAPQGALDSVLSAFAKSLDAYGPSAVVLSLPLAVLLQVLQQVAAGLLYLHNQSIIYRDLKADNVLAWRMPSCENLADCLQDPTRHRELFHGAVHVKLSDYGISRMSATGSVRGLAGTPGFMAPEIVTYSGQEGYTRQVDIYSFGMFMYELMTLGHPYHGVMASHIESLTRDGILPYPTARVLNQPVQLQYLMQHCAALDAGVRPRTMQLTDVLAEDRALLLADVILLPTAQAQLCSALTMTPSANADSAGRMWLSCAAEDPLGRVTLHCIQYGGTNSATQVEQVLETMSTSFVCSSGDCLWACCRDGNVCILEPETTRVLLKWNIADQLQLARGTALDSHVQCMQVANSLERVFLAMSNGVLLSYPASIAAITTCTPTATTAATATPDTDRQSERIAPLVAVIKSTFVMESVPVAAGCPAGNQLWCGHAGDMVTVLSADDLHVIADLQPAESRLTPFPIRTVLHMALARATKTDAARMWTASSPSSHVHCWSVSASPSLVSAINCDSTASGNVVIKDMSCALGILAVALSNGCVAVIDVHDLRLVRTVGLHRGPVDLIRIVSFDGDDEDDDTVSSSTWRLSRRHATNWLPLYLQSISPVAAGSTVGMTQCGSPGSAVPLVITSGAGLQLPAPCHPVSTSPETRVLSSDVVLALWDARQVLASN